MKEERWQGRPLVNDDHRRGIGRIVMEVYGLGLLQMVEKVGRTLAEVASRRIGGSVGGRRDPGGSDEGE